MKILVKSSCTAEGMGWGSAALIQIDQEFRDKLAQYRELHAKLRAEHNVLELTFWDCRCYWYDNIELEDGDQMEELGVPAPEDGEDYIVLPDDFDFDDDANEDEDDGEDPESVVHMCRTAADRLIIDQESFSFRAYVKHADSANVETWGIPWDAIICPVHGTSEEAERTCLRCVAKR